MIVVAGESETLYYYHFDGLGSVAALSDVNSVIVERYSYDVFGEPNRVSAIDNPYMFTGRRYDAETGLYYYRARYYKPEIGRFLQTDPIGYAGGLNLYTYCFNDPVNYVDPFGLRRRNFLGFGSNGTSPSFRHELLDLGEGSQRKGSNNKKCPKNEPSKSAKEAADKLNKGKNPGPDWKKKGPNWYNEKTGESLHPDLGHGEPDGPHYDWHRRQPGKNPEGKFFPDGSFRLH